MLFTPCAKEFVFGWCVGAMISHKPAACVAHGVNMIGEAHSLASRVVGQIHISCAELFFENLGLDIHGPVHTEDRFVEIDVAHDLITNGRGVARNRRTGLLSVASRSRAAASSAVGCDGRSGSLRRIRDRNISRRGGPARPNHLKIGGGEDWLPW